MPALNTVPFVSVDNMMRLVHAVGIETMLVRLAQAVAEDFLRWDAFHKTPRIATHSPDGVIELMPTSDGRTYGFKYVNGHPKNAAGGRQTVTAFGVLAEVETGYPVLISEMTLLTALRTAATSALAARHLARAGSRTMALIGNGAQAEFQALAFRALLGVDACASPTSTRRPRASACATSPASASTSRSAAAPRRRSAAPTSSPR